MSCRYNKSFGAVSLHTRAEIRIRDLRSRLAHFVDNLTSFGGSLKIQTDFCTKVHVHMITHFLLLFAETIHTFAQASLLLVSAHGVHHAAEIVHSFASTGLDIDTEFVCHGDVYATIIGLWRLLV